jgi:hypothetical protein
LETFLSRYHEREPLIINRDSPSHYQDLASVETLQDILCAAQLTADDLQVADDSRDIRSGRIPACRREG